MNEIWFGSLLRAAGLAGLAISFSGCADLHHGYESLTRSAGTPVAAADGTAADSTATTVHGRPVRASMRAEPEQDESAVTRMAAIPSTQQIFDFHPGGSQKWRAPVIIDPKEDPLSADDRRTAAELRELMTEQEAGQTKVAKVHCGETEIAARKPGCLLESQAAHASVSSTGQVKSAPQ